MTTEEFAEIAAAKQTAYAEQRRLYREAREIAETEDFCARKELTPGTYKPVT